MVVCTCHPFEQKARSKQSLLRVVKTLKILPIMTKIVDFGQFCKFGLNGLRQPCL